ncbi:hypothetical protein [Microbacterium sp. ZW T5_56]|uniref:hypothetical protein n=1 Tax=Microbacterium sp. ZW T5_56 TaxID=3378081 RepID=UPI003852365B
MTDPQQPTWPAPQPHAPQQPVPQQGQQTSWPAPGSSGQPTGSPAAPQAYPTAPQAYTGGPQTPPATPQGYPGTPQGYPTAQSYPGAPQVHAAQPIQPWPAAPSATAGPALAGNTPWAWLIGALAFVQILAYLVVDWQAVIELNLALVAVSFGGISPAAMSTYVGAVVPSLVLAAVIALLCYAASVVFAFLDQRALARMGVTKPFPWGWNFLAQPLVYMIGRTVVLSRNGRRGMAPLWLAIAGTVASWVISTVVTFSSFYNMG